jgi:hypothetical protein
MKRIVYYVTLTLIWPAVLLPAPAQQDGTRQQTLEQVRQRLEEIKDRLQLTPEQIEKVRPILVDELQQLRSVQQKYNSSDQNRRTRLKMARELRDIRSSADDKLQKILSRKQMEELRQIREELRQERRDRAGQK